MQKLLVKMQLTFHFTLYKWKWKEEKTSTWSWKRDNVNHFISTHTFIHFIFFLFRYSAVSSVRSKKSSSWSPLTILVNDEKWLNFNKLSSFYRIFLCVDSVHSASYREYSKIFCNSRIHSLLNCKDENGKREEKV
jgi:hypothetical protein